MDTVVSSVVWQFYLLMSFGFPDPTPICTYRAACPCFHLLVLLSPRSSMFSVPLQCCSAACILQQTILVLWRDWHRRSTVFSWILLIPQGQFSLRLWKAWDKSVLLNSRLILPCLFPNIAALWSLPLSFHLHGIRSNKASPLISLWLACIMKLPSICSRNLQPSL